MSRVLRTEIGLVILALTLLSLHASPTKRPKGATSQKEKQIRSEYNQKIFTEKEFSYKEKSDYELQQIMNNYHDCYKRYEQKKGKYLLEMKLARQSRNYKDEQAAQEKYEIAKKRQQDKCLMQRDQQISKRRKQMQQQLTSSSSESEEDSPGPSHRRKDTSESRDTDTRKALRATLDLAASRKVWYSLQQCAQILVNLATCRDRHSNPAWNQVKQLYQQKCKWDELLSLRQLQHLCSTIEQTLGSLETQRRQSDKLSVSSCAQLRRLVISLERHGHNLGSNPNQLLQKLSLLHRNYCKVNCEIKFENSALMAKFTEAEGLCFVASSEEKRAKTKGLFVFEQTNVVAVVGGERWTCGFLSQEQILVMKQNTKIASLKNKLKEVSRKRISHEQLLLIRAKVDQIHNSLRRENRESFRELQTWLEEEEKNKFEYKFHKEKLLARVGGEEFSEVALDLEEQKSKNLFFYLLNGAIIDVRRGINKVCGYLTLDQQQDWRLILQIRQTLAKFQQLDLRPKISQHLCKKAVTLAEKLTENKQHLKLRQQLTDAIQMYCSPKARFKCVTRIQEQIVSVKLAESEDFQLLASSCEEMDSLGSSFFLDGQIIFYQHQDQKKYPCGNLSPQELPLFQSAAGRLGRTEGKIINIDLQRVDTIKCLQIRNQLLDLSSQMRSTPDFVRVVDLFDSKCFLFTKQYLKKKIFPTEDASCQLSFEFNGKQQRLYAQKAQFQKLLVSLSRNPNVLRSAAYVYSESEGNIYCQLVKPPVVCATLTKLQIAMVDTIRTQIVFSKLQTLYDDFLTDVQALKSQRDDVQALKRLRDAEEEMCLELQSQLKKCAWQIMSRKSSIGAGFPAYLYDVAAFVDIFVEKHCKIRKERYNFPGVLTNHDYREVNSMEIELMSQLRNMQNNKDFPYQKCKEVLSYLKRTFHIEQILYSSLSQAGRIAVHELIQMFRSNCVEEMANELEGALPINIMRKIPCRLSFENGQVMLEYHWFQKKGNDLDRFAKVGLEDNAETNIMFDEKRNVVLKKLAPYKEWYTFCVPSQQELNNLEREVVYKMSREVDEYQQSKALTKAQCSLITKLLRDTPNNLSIELKKLKWRLKAIHKDKCQLRERELVQEINEFLCTITTTMPVEKKMDLCRQIAKLIANLNSKFHLHLSDYTSKKQRQKLMGEFQQKCNKQESPVDVKEEINYVCEYKLKGFNVAARVKAWEKVRQNMNYLKQDDEFILRKRRIFIKTGSQEYVQCAQITMQQQKLLWANILTEMNRIRESFLQIRTHLNYQLLQAVQQFIQFSLLQTKESNYKKARKQFLQQYLTTRAYLAINEKIMETQGLFSAQTITAQLCNQIALEITAMVRSIQDHIQGQIMDHFDQLMILYNKKCVALNQHSLMWYLSDQKDPQQFRWSQNGNLEVRTLKGFELVKINQAHKQTKSVMFKYQNNQIYKLKASGEWLLYTEGQQFDPLIWKEFFISWNYLIASIENKQKSSSNFDSEKKAIQRLIISISEEKIKKNKRQFQRLLREYKNTVNGK